MAVGRTGCPAQEINDWRDWIALNEAYAPKEVLLRVHDAFEQIAGGVASCEEGDARIYHFDGFGVTVPADAPLQKRGIPLQNPHASE